MPNGSIKLIEDIEDAKNFTPNQTNKLAYITQTTLSVDDTIEIIHLLKSRYPTIKSPHKNDICYATTNRQEVVKSISKLADVIFVVGSEHSSNSQRLVEVGKKSGCKASYLIEDETKIKWDVLDSIKNLAITAGASAPEVIVERIIKEISKKYKINLVHNTYTEENISFKLPKIKR